MFLRSFPPAGRRGELLVLRALWAPGQGGSLSPPGRHSRRFCPLREISRSCPQNPLGLCAWHLGVGLHGGFLEMLRAWKPPLPHRPPSPLTGAPAAPPGLAAPGGSRTPPGPAPEPTLLAWLRPRFSHSHHLLPAPPYLVVASHVAFSPLFLPWERPRATPAQALGSRPPSCRALSAAAASSLVCLKLLAPWRRRCESALVLTLSSRGLLLWGTRLTTAP